MKVPISWLKEYVDITIPVEELAERLTLAGLEVEHTHFIGLPGAELAWDKDKIFVGQLLGVERHPNADKLLLATVEYGAAQPITVVTGAPNIKPGDAGQKVVLALNGARLYDGHAEGKKLMTLKPAMLRGIKNDSMVCSEKELGLSEEHDGIILLPDDAPVGSPLADYMGDVVLEIAILPNTARCASILGVAREVAALTGQRVRYPATDYAESDPNVNDEVAITIEEPKLNPRFTATVIKGVAQMPSPEWMQRRLKLIGMRPINNIVDISNYVMMETGQPTHAFDFDAVQTQPDGKKHIGSRLAKPGETLITLDGKPHELLPSDVVVMEPGRALSVAGVMGGLDSEVKDTTTNILHEVAAWDYVSIRRTARHHNFHSEASYRFARGVHPELTILAQKRYLHLLQKHGGGKILRGMVDAYPLPASLISIELNPGDVNRMLGVAVPVEDQRRILESLEFEVTQERSGRLEVIVPQHRLDVTGEHDLAEEIARIYGYDKIPATLMRDEIPHAAGSPKLDFEERVKDILVEAGLQEVIPYRMTLPEREMKAFVPGTPADDRKYVTLLNPITPDRTVMRHSMAAGLLEILASNLRHHPSAEMFEVGAVYWPAEDGAVPDELPRLGMVMGGVRGARTWHEAADTPMDFYDIKGAVENALAALNVKADYKPATHPTYYPGRTAEVFGNGKRLGVFGEVHPLVREQFEITAPAFLAELDMAALREIASEITQTQDVPRFPAVSEDLAVIVDEALPAAQVESAIRRSGGNLLRKITLFDVYRGESLGAGKKSLAYSLEFMADDRTLGDADVEKARNKIIRNLEGQLGAVVRK